MTDEILSNTITSIARDYAAIRQTLVDQAVDHKLLREEVRQLRARIEMLGVPQQSQTPIYQPINIPAKVEPNQYLHNWIVDPNTPCSICGTIRPQTLGQAATPGTNWEWTGKDTGRDAKP